MSSAPSAQFFPYSLPVKGSVTVETDTDKFFVVGRACELSAFSYAPVFMNKTGPTRSFFGKSRDPPAMQFYDKVYHLKQEEGYNQDLHRCDRTHANSKGLEVNTEESTRAIPVLWNSNYGHISPPTDIPQKDRVKKNNMTNEFLRKNGVTIAFDEEPKRMAGKGP